jgi:TusA-related sulfurtransferase
LYHPILKMEEWSGEGQMTLDATGETCIHPMVEVEVKALPLQA